MVCICHILIMHSSIGLCTPLGYYKCATVNSFGHIPRSRIWVCGDFMFNLLRNHHTIFPSSCTISFSIPTSSVGRFKLLHILTNTYYLSFDSNCASGYEWYIIVVLICISLVTNHVEHFFMCWLVVCTSSLEKCLFMSFTCCLIGLFVVELWEWLLHSRY